MLILEGMGMQRVNINDMKCKSFVFATMKVIYIQLNFCIFNLQGHLLSCNWFYINLYNEK